MAGRVAGKIVVVTWGARGQGAAEAAALAAEGATVIASDVIEPTAELPAGVTFERLDVTDPGSWSRLGDLLRDRHGRVDGLINNAGIPHRARLGEVTFEDAERVLRVNLNVVHPGFIETPMSAEAGVPDWFRIQHDIAAALGRGGTPEDIAPAIVFLISDESSWISGAELAVDGGFSGQAGARMISGPLTPARVTRKS